jgi:hypothetical protein
MHTNPHTQFSAALGAGTLEAIAAAAGNPFFAEEIAGSVDDGDVHVPEHVSAILDVRRFRTTITA